jgi:hypothetical protein
MKFLPRLFKLSFTTRKAGRCERPVSELLYEGETLLVASNGNVLFCDEVLGVNDGMTSEASCSFDCDGNERSDASLRIESLTVS